MDLAFGVDEDATEEEDEAAKGQNCGSYELDVKLHGVGEFQNLMQICPQFWRFCKFFTKKSTKLSPGVLQEGFNIGFIDRLSEAVKQVFNDTRFDMFSCALIEALMYFVRGHRVPFFFERSTISRLYKVAISRRWTEIASGLSRLRIGL